ncbi:uncharacterized protein LOC135490017 [Lineus longissimus]|uniref:uncharacterized protein LOC135490017 n=1 Tax=Lineus longissimus TaxID=88925 RepID=UPI00315DF78A
MRIQCVVLIFITLLALFCSFARSVTVTTDVGEIIGIESTWKGKIVKKFFGIPFAEAPVGNLRFRPPIPKVPFTKPFSAEKIGHSCLQNEHTLRNFSGMAFETEEEINEMTVNEDCLNLNIWVPEGGEETKAVMIWIHGGAFVFGAGAQYNATKLAIFGDVIVVSVNYRLGILGFFSTFDDIASGNYGLMDQQLAFKWVQQNIGAFGGDKDRVTIFGESAGSASVTWQMLVPSNEGLFQRVIAESGTAFSEWAFPDPETAKRYFGILVEKLNCSGKDSGEVIACFRSLPAEAFGYGTSIGYPHAEELAGRTPAGPRADGEFIPFSPTATDPKEKMQDLPFFRSRDLMIGANRFEGSPYVNSVFAPLYKARTNQSMYDTGVPKNMIKGVLSAFFPGKNDQGLVDAVWWLYSTSVNGNTNDFMPAIEFLELAGDLMFYDGIDKFLKRHAAETAGPRGSTYQYSFLPEPSETFGTMGLVFEKEPCANAAIHADELGFIFCRPSILANEDKILKAELDLSDAMIAYWTNFAKSGNPNEPMSVPRQWPQYKMGEEEFIEFDIQNEQLDLRTNSFYRNRYVSYWNDVIPLITRPAEEKCHTREKAESPDQPKTGKDELYINVFLVYCNHQSFAMGIQCVVLIFITLVALFCSFARSVTVTTDVGEIIGTESTWKGKIVRKFFGIPFAEAPVGDLRFRPPIPKVPFTKPFSAEKIGHSCLQNEQMLKNFSGMAFETEEETNEMTVNEDCLNLNIWVPEGGEETKAVMIWIHGGSFLFGAGAQYNATKLAIFGDVIVVSVNYRLGIFGFISTFDDVASGNYGLMDQQLAFKWVQQNIGAFGGDKDRVTIFGESAGSASVTWQMLVPSNEGLFQRVIAESGTAFSEWAFPDPETAKRYFGILVEKLNCSGKDSSEVIACFRSLPAEAFGYEALMGFPHAEELAGRTPAGPRVDGQFIPFSPTATDLKERMQDLPFFRSRDLMIGANRFEGSPFINLMFAPLYQAQTNQSLYDTGVPKYMIKEVLSAFFPGKIDQKLVDAVWWLYSTSVNGNTNDFMPAIECLELAGDLMFYDGTNKVLKRHAAETAGPRGSTYQYSFLPEPSETVGSLGLLLEKEPCANGAIHADEIGFIFCRPGMLANEDKILKAELDLSDAMIAYWTNFAKSGNPNEPMSGPRQWPQYKMGEEEFIEFDIQNEQLDLRINSFYRNRYVSFWDEVISLITRPAEEKCHTREKAESTDQPKTAKDDNSCNHQSFAMGIQCVVLIFITLVALLCSFARSVTVTTDVGEIIGIESTWKGKIVRKFFGIPFAEAPVGNLRFRPPIPKVPFTKPFSAEKIGHSCLQNEPTLRNFSGMAFETEEEINEMTVNEDCLNLNIWVPEGGEETKAVMIWIHGGAFLFGAGAQYNATKLVIFGDVIVVSVNYRLGIFGFISTFDDVASGNYGLMDQQLAFKWVQQNIGAFGGDKDRVTIFGESAGSASVTWQMLVPSNEGLFQRVIAESGTAFSGWAFPDPERAKRYFGILVEKLNCSGKDSSEVIACFRSLPAEAFGYEALMGFSHAEELSGRTPAGPRVDGEFIPFSPTATDPKERMQDLPFFRSRDLMIGANRFEGSPFINLMFAPLYKAQTNQSLYDTGVPKYMIKEVLSAFFRGKIDQELVDAVWWLYSTSVNGNTNDFMPAIECLELAGDLMFYDGTNKVLKRHAAETAGPRGSTYQYSFLPEPSETVGSLGLLLEKEPCANGAIHADEIGFIFCRPGMLANEDKILKAELDLSDAMIAYWTNFAKSGNPNEPMSVPRQWPQYKMGEEEFIAFDIRNEQLDLRINSFYRNRYVSFWDEVIPLITRPAEEKCHTREKAESTDQPKTAKDDNSCNHQSFAMGIQCVVLIFITLVALLCSFARSVTVTTDVGEIIGIESTWKGKIVRKFFGIPFAEAPVGNLRFRPPIPKVPFTKPFSAEKIGHSCLQNEPTLRNFSGMAFETEEEINEMTVNEDCLNLNIWVPEGGEETKAVMIWIHGGAFLFGAGAQYNATKLAIFGDVIVVSVNYRLGIFGFISTFDDVASGNYGLMDQQLAFKWVQQNIGAFGGDKDRVTIFGESAGSASVTWQMLVPSNEGLFQRVIAESGTAFSGWAFPDPERAKRYFGILVEKLNCSGQDSSEVIACFRSLPAEAFGYEALMGFSHAEELSGRTPAGPRVDGEFIPFSPTATDPKERMQDLPFFRSRDLMIGANRFEGSPFINLMFAPLYKAQTNQSLYDTGVPKYMIKEVLSAFFPGKIDQELVDAVWWLYSTSVNGNTNDFMPAIECLELAGDLMFYDGTNKVLKRHAAETAGPRGSTYQYSFLPEPSETVGSLGLLLEKEPCANGAIHADEIGFIFCRPGMLAYEDKILKAELDLSDAMIAYWTNFAKSGSPNEPMSVPRQWPQYKMGEEEFIAFDIRNEQLDLRINSFYRNRYVSFWDEVIPLITRPAEEKCHTREKAESTDQPKTAKDEL